MRKAVKAEITVIGRVLISKDENALVPPRVVRNVMADTIIRSLRILLVSLLSIGLSPRVVTRVSFPP